MRSTRRTKRLLTNLRRNAWDRVTLDPKADCSGLAELVRRPLTSPPSGCPQEFIALDWFDAAVLREKAARRAKGMSEELGSDIIRLLGETARRKGTL